MKYQNLFLGIDAGSVALSAVLINHDREIIASGYVFHQGDVQTALETVMAHFPIDQIGGVAATSSTPARILADERFDNRVAVITAIKQRHTDIGSILILGGEKFGLLLFDEDGTYRNYKSNTSCAAGTGSFLDQQAKRLNLNGIQELSSIAYANTGAIPPIASRCAVFAKTDLIHAQQEGYSLSEICDGLCHGLARNIVDTLFNNENPRLPLLLSGGVSQNQAVVRHIRELIGMTVQVDELSHLHGALGAALCGLEHHIGSGEIRFKTVNDLISRKQKSAEYFFDPLALQMSDYPDFTGRERYDYAVQGITGLTPVEVDIYEELVPGARHSVYLGIDIGSTSTKAVLLDRDRRVLAGLYTRTIGRPVEVTQGLLEAIDDLRHRNGICLSIIGAGTTGSGRKMIGRIIGADLIMDEITAHARAACELNPAVDTIIEIGGQDAKFTTLKNGMVTFSVMNSVCAAGTGSFIEEQAQKLGCRLSDYAARAENIPAPMASDRCTVFMERDINHYLTEGYSVNEMLAATLHSIRENYLSKVAIEKMIGATVFFQGATAKNKALVAAFEQRLQRPILVSRFCHLTGALGTALLLAEQQLTDTRFRGLGLCREQLPIRSEVCGLCTNHCKITVADVHGEPVAYGFLCGRDYDTKKFVDNNRSGFDLIRERKKVFSVPAPKNPITTTTIGIPAALHITEDLPLWKRFFHELSIPIVTSERYTEGVKEGKQLTGAEFCAPIAALHGHVRHVLDRADYVFLPCYLERRSKEKDLRRQYCYYTQYMPALLSMIAPEKRDRFLMPLATYLYKDFHTKRQLFAMLKGIPGLHIGFREISAAYDRALQFKETALQHLRQRYQSERQNAVDIGIVFVGRPYTILEPSMNKGIPEIFGALGIKTFYQDMIPYTRDDVSGIQDLLNEFHWHYASTILEATEAVAQKDGLYPVFVTSFKCAPDSFTLDYFKHIMESHQKPYLILQLDEHDSNVGYETRIEAAVRSFRNHHAAARKSAPVQYHQSLKPRRIHALEGKTLLMPNWDRYSMPLVAATLRTFGVDIRLLEETPGMINQSMKGNSGQCIPINIIAQECIEYVTTHGLDPSKTAVWTIDSRIGCNLGLYPHHLRNLINGHGHGFEKCEVYAGDLSFIDINMNAPINIYFSFMFGGLLRKIGCRLRPYEKEKGLTDKIIGKCIAILSEAFSGKRSKEDALNLVVSLFDIIDTVREDRPQIALIGDIYSRDNDILNQGLVHFIEENGGEVITTPYNSYIKMIARSYIRKYINEGHYFDAVSKRALLSFVDLMEDRYYQYFEKILHEPDHAYDEPAERILSAYNVRLENTGESLDNILKTYYIKKYYPDVSLFVQASPAFCCPSMVTEAMAKSIERATGVPLVTITYDGTSSFKNDIIVPYLKYPRKRTDEPECDDDLRLRCEPA